MNYDVTISEESEQIFRVEASTEDEARELAEKNYNEGLAPLSQRFCQWEVDDVSVVTE